MNLYYKIWVDALVKLRSLPKNEGIWKFYAMAFISMSMAFNLILILFILNDLGIIKGFFKITIDVFPGEKIDGFLSFFISYLLPFLLLNYFLIFYKNKYQELVRVCPYYEGKLFLKYFLGSIGAIVLYFFTAVLITVIFQG